MPSLRLRRAPAALTFLAAVALSSVARADAPAAALTRILASPGRPHPLADAQGRVPFTVVLPPGASAAGLGLLSVAPGIGAARLAPAALAAFAAGHPELALGFEPPRRPLLDVSRGWIHLDQFRTATGKDGSGVVVGVVDTGIDIHHRDFRDANGKTRIAWMLNAEAPLGLHPEVEAAFGCDDPKQSECAVYAAADIDALIAQGSRAIHDAEGHGTHVASIAAGNGGLGPPKDGPTYAGVAPGATLVIASPASDKGFYDADILRGARFVFDRAAALGTATTPAPPAVCNLSLGGDFGPHDGTSALEKGLAAMVGDDQPGRAVVVAAGNSGALIDFGDGPSGVHTEARVTPGGITRVPLRSSASTKGQGFIWITFRAGDVVDVALEGPSGSRWVGFNPPGEESGYDDGEGTTAGVVNNRVGASSSITADTNSAVVVVQGAWPEGSEINVLLRGHGTASLWVVGTGDVAPGAHIGLVFERAIREGTVTVPASAPGLLAVGCTLNRLQWTPFQSDPIKIGALGGEEDPVPDGACYFSASGPTPLGVIKPEISAPGGFVVGAMSSEADPRHVKGGLFDSTGCPDAKKPCFLVDDEHAVAAGTSMSAPQVAGAVALLMQIDPTLTQARVTEILEAGARKPTGRVPFDYQLGPGVLDLEGARQALAEDATTGGSAPDLTRSWYTLSSPYASVDVAAPVWGTIELRRADGRLASGLDGTRLALTVANGVVARPLVKVRHGLFRFAVAGAPGHVGEAVTIDVRYDGASLGVRSLPIGTDAWTADGVVDAVGGCAVTRGGGARPTGWAFGFAAVGGLALALARRRARGSAPGGPPAPR